MALVALIVLPSDMSIMMIVGIASTVVHHFMVLVVPIVLPVNIDMDPGIISAYGVVPNPMELGVRIALIGFTSSNNKFMELDISWSML